MEIPEISRWPAVRQLFGADRSGRGAVTVGDTPDDVTAHAAGTACVGVGSHNFTVEQLGDAGADYAIASLAEPVPL